MGPPHIPRRQRPRQDLCIAAADGSSLRLKADPLEREALLAQGEPFFVPAYIRNKGWVGKVCEHPDTDWQEVAELIATSYCLVAPKRLARRVSRPPSIAG